VAQRVVTTLTRISQDAESVVRLPPSKDERGMSAREVPYCPASPPRHGRFHPAMSMITSEPGGSADLVNVRRTLSIDQSTVIGP
jgi:hypothetical protein